MSMYPGILIGPHYHIHLVLNYQWVTGLLSRVVGLRCDHVQLPILEHVQHSRKGNYLVGEP